MDFFNELIISKKPDAKDYFIKLLVVFCSTFLAFMSFLYITKYIIIVLAAIIYADYYLFTSFSTEFEYSVTNGEVDIDKIIAKRRRKHIVSVSSKNFVYFAPYNEKHISAINKMSVTKTYFCASSNKSKNAYFAIFDENEKNKCLVFEPNNRMIDDLFLRADHTNFYKE